MIQSLWNDTRAAAALLTRLPIGGGALPPVHQAAWSFGLVGVLIGAVQALVAGLGLAAGLPSAVVAGLVLICAVLLTGALHEDGLSDTADGLGAWDRARRLEIMRDSRVGAYGVLALVLSVGLRWAALAALCDQGAIGGAVIVAGALSRAAMVPVMATLPHARADGLSRAAGRPSGRVAAQAIGVALGVSVLWSGAGFVGAALVACAAATGMWRLARAKLGGQTGDILGATQQLVEIAVLIWFCAAL